MNEQAMIEDNDDINENDPVFRAILEFCMSALYESGAAKQLAQSLKAAPDAATGLSDAAYKIIDIAGERFEESLDDELLPLLAIVILQEVAEIGEAAGIQYKGSDLAEALRQMILRFLQESGYDSAELEAAMSQVDRSVFDKAGAM